MASKQGPTTAKGHGGQKEGCLYPLGSLKQKLRRSKQEYYQEVVDIDLNCLEKSIKLSVVNLLRHYSKIIRILFKKFSGTGSKAGRMNNFDQNRQLKQSITIPEL